MKLLFGCLAACAVVLHSMGQGNVLVANKTAEVDRTPVVRASMTIANADEGNFWRIYNDYADEKLQSLEKELDEYKHLIDISETEDRMTKNTFVENWLAEKQKDIKNRQLYYQELCKQTNTLVGLQFLQTEELLDIVTRSTWFDQYAQYKPVMHVEKINRANYNQEKRKMLSDLLDIDEPARRQFWQLFNNYQFEYDTLFGSEIGVFLQCVEDLPEHLTPSVAKEIGKEFLDIQRDEVKLKEKYYMKIEKAIGPALTAKFLILEDYFANVTKMHATTKQEESASIE
jgi:hypothetical protein